MALGLALWLTAHGATAQDRPEPEIRLGLDTSVDPTRLREQLRVELAGLARRPLRVDVQQGRAGLHVTLTFDESDPIVQDVVLEDVATADRERVLSLAIAEATRLGPAPPAAALSVPPPVSRPPPSRPLAPRAAPPVRTPALRPGFEATLGARLFPRLTHVAVEPRVGAFVRHRTGLRADAGGFYDYAHASSDLGGVTLHAFGLSVAGSYDAAWSPRVSVRVGPRVDVAFAQGSGSATGSARESTVTGTMLGFYGEASIRVALNRALAVLAAADGGGVARGIDLQVDGASVLLAKGAAFGLRIGVSSP